MTTYWWFRPSRIVLFIALPIHVLAYGASDAVYAEFGAYNAITADNFFLIWASLLGFAGASWFGEVLVAERHPPPPPLLDEGVFRCLLFGLALVATAGTLVFLSPFMKNPTLALNIIAGRPGAAELARLYAESIPGVTSLENLFNLVIVLFMVKPVLTGHRRTLVETLLLIFILALTAVKVVLNSERLALIELLVPLGLLACAVRRRSALIALAPFGAIGGMCAFFTGTEYLRSWVTYYAGKSGGVWDFAVQRMFGYYITAINNGAYIYNLRHSYLFPVFSAGWLWRLPVPGLPDAMAELVGAPAAVLQTPKDLLYGMNVEFNNTSGIFAPLTDFGPLLGPLVWTALGYLSGRLYRRFQEGRPIGLLLFPTWFVGVLEVPRIFYWGDNRYFPALTVSLSIAALLLLSKPASYRRAALLAAVAVGMAAVSPARADIAPVSITDFGADASGRYDSTQAIGAAIHSARLRGAAVYVPAGTFRHRGFSLDGIGMSGSGSGSVLLAPSPENATICLSGTAPFLRDLAVTVRSSRRDDRNWAVRIDGARGFAVEHVTIRGGNAGGILDYGGEDGRIAGNYVSATLADAIHNTHGAHDVTVTGNTVRNTGDDMVAVVSYANEKPAHDIRIDHNDLADQLHGRGISVVGGRAVSIESNQVARTRCCAGIYIASEAAWRTQGVAGVVVRDNVLTANGGATGHGAITVFSDREPVRDVRIAHNTIIDARGFAVKLIGRVSDVSLNDNRFIRPAAGEIDASRQDTQAGAPGR